MIRRFLTRVLIVILIAACGVNWLQLQRLQEQVAELQKEHIPGQSSAVKAHTPEARLSLNDLQTQWKHLCSQADGFRMAGKKAFFHEIPN